MHAPLLLLSFLLSVAGTSSPNEATAPPGATAEPMSMTTQRFPPVLLLPEAQRWTLASTDELHGARRKPVCRRAQDRFASMVREAERVLRTPDHAIFLRETSDLQRRIGMLDDPACPEMRAQLKLLQAFLEEHKALYPSMHAADADVPFAPAKATGKTQAALVAQFNALHDSACAKGALDQQISAQMWCDSANQTHAPARRQRYLLNLTRDRALVHRDGSVGGTCRSEQFLALAETSHSHDKAQPLAVLQGQGPVLGEDVARYLDAATHYAERQKLGYVLFVNAAEGTVQIPSFAAQVAQRSHANGITLDYLGTETWSDGGLVSPADAAAFAKQAAERIAAHKGGAALVVNCNAGLDRSGMLNVLVQLIVQTDRQYAKNRDKDQLLRFGYALIPQLTQSIKRARPHGISAPARYIFIHRAFEAYVQSLS